MWIKEYKRQIWWCVSLGDYLKIGQFVYIWWRKRYGDMESGKKGWNNNSGGWDFHAPIFSLLRCQGVEWGSMDFQQKHVNIRVNDGHKYIK